jgi:hypothetical protein
MGYSLLRYVELVNKFISIIQLHILFITYPALDPILNQLNETYHLTLSSKTQYNNITPIYAHLSSFEFSRI